MELHFASLQLQRVAESADRSDALLGKRAAAMMRQRLCELAAADNLSIVKALPTLGLHSLPNRSRCYAVRLTPSLRLTFELIVGTRTAGKDADLDLAQVVAIRILAIEETDGR
jgi:hypothetical protein